MSRKTRLQDLVSLMRRHGEPVSGTTLAETLGISLRTLYQDVAVLKAVGADIEHVPGTGYALAPGVLLPALMLTDDELDALALGLGKVEDSAGPLAAPAAQLRGKMVDALSDEQAQRLAGVDRAVAEPVTHAFTDEHAPSAELVFYTNPLSRGSIVHWMLEELGVAYRMVVLDYGTTMKDPDYLALNPMGKVPAICHGDVVVTETAAICAYLADAFPEAGLAPPPAHRGDYYRWLFFTAGPLETALSLNGLLGVHPTEQQQMQLGCGSLQTVLDTLAGVLAGRRYIAGDTFSAADIYVGSHLSWGLQFGSIPWRPEFEAYCAGLNERPARQRCEAFLQQAMAQGA
ncbi:HTH domain-containing protein [Halomonas salinarum]|uniref:HTH domain-containing protein n=1 Tax=Halomonas salinarum TaxID=1158993 RepID=UPI00143A3714|nr:HTH domain-containing protein [Halomonas salinarum]